MVQNREINILTWFYFFLNCFAALESIAVDAWLLTLLAEHELPKGALADVLGQTAGSFITYSIFGTLSSINF